MQKTKLSAQVSLWIVLFVLFLDWMGLGLVYPIFSSMLFDGESPLLNPATSAATRGWYLGLLLASMSIAQFFTSPILGALSDQKGRRPLLMLSISLGVVAYVVCTFGVWMGSLSVLIMGRTLVGAAAGNAAIVTAAVADLSTSKNKARHFGLLSMASGVGFTVGPFLGGKLSEFGYATPFLVSGIATFLNLLLVYFLFQETHLHLKSVPIRFGDGVRNLQKAFTMPGLRILFLVILLFCFGWSFFYEFIPVTWIADYGFGPGEIGFFYAYGSGCYALSSGYLIRPLVDRYKNVSVLFYALLTMGWVILLLLCRPSADWLWVYLAVVNFLAALVFPTSTAMVSDWAGKDAQGEILGISQSVQSAAFAISPLAAGSFLGANPHMPMLLGGVSILLAALILGLALRKQIFNL
jgi:DHA1 family tetracycline resistance protein-like MFS transporter